MTYSGRIIGNIRLEKRRPKKIEREKVYEFHDYLPILDRKIRRHVREKYGRELKEGQIAAYIRFIKKPRKKKVLPPPREKPSLIKRLGIGW